MNRRGAWIIWLLLCCIPLGGCWNYRGLDTLDIVTGMAVDKDLATGGYLLTFEIVDTQTAGKETPIQVKYVEARGETLFSAIRNAKKRLINKLYGGNMQAVVISRQVAAEEGIFTILEEILRDGEPRETLSVAISQEKTAQAILLTEGLDSKIIAFEIHETIDEDKRTTGSTRDVALYQAYNAIKEPGSALVLPALHRVQNLGAATAEANGVALFRRDKLLGFLSAEQTPYYLLIVNELQGGVLSFPYSESDSKISLEIKSCDSKTAVRYEAGQLVVSVSIKTTVNLMELKAGADLSKPEEREKLESYTERYLEQRTASLFQSVQAEYGTDIFGLGRLLYKDDPALWRQLQNGWDPLLRQARIEVHARADILNTGVLKDY
ncbi:MAG: Ger(x)C family spore germination protein [Sporomusaceae bacterium]|nr:Ger(x)C family spore germination protein [Sporomusaceae bacterium]